MRHIPIQMQHPDWGIPPLRGRVSIKVETKWRWDTAVPSRRSGVFSFGTEDQTSRKFSRPERSNPMSSQHPKSAHTETRAIDPVCGMDVDPADTAYNSEFHGETYYFCSAICKDQFDNDPDEYVGGGQPM
jgi:YHS domain-containing protein